MSLARVSLVEEREVEVERQHDGPRQLCLLRGQGESHSWAVILRYRGRLRRFEGIGAGTAAANVRMGTHAAAMTGNRGEVRWKQPRCRYGRGTATIWTR